MRIRLKYVIEDVDRHGNVRLYFRKKGQPKIRLPGLPGSDEFMASYKGALAGTQTAKPKLIKGEKARAGTFKWLCEEYFASAEFRALEPKTQLLRRRILDLMCEQHGTKPVSQIEPIHVRRLRDQILKPEAANSFLKTLRQLFSFGSCYGLIHYNPARDIPYIRSKGDGFHLWTEAEVAQFESTHPIGSPARLAMAIILYTGQRRSDAIRLGRQHVREGRIEFTQHKNRTRSPVTLSIPIHPSLQQVMDASAKGNMQFIVTKFGKPFTDAGFGNRFRKWCDEAGLAQCSAHGLRKVAAVRLAEAGCTEREIMAITGHRTSRQVAYYTRGVNQQILSDSALAKLVEGETKNKSVPLSEVVEQSGTISSPNTLKAKG